VGEAWGLSNNVVLRRVSGSIGQNIICNVIFSLQKDSMRIEFLKLTAAFTRIAVVNKHL
jgi:hypothetical protein